MTEPFFFNPQAGMTVGEIADMTGATPRGPIEMDRAVGGLAPLDRAGPHELTFLDNAKYSDGLRTTRAGACLTSERFASACAGVAAAPGHARALSGVCRRGARALPGCLAAVVAF